jgi:hypothetical protein
MTPSVSINSASLYTAAGWAALAPAYGSLDPSQNTPARSNLRGLGLAVVPECS